MRDAMASMGGGNGEIREKSGGMRYINGENRETRGNGESRETCGGVRREACMIKEPSVWRNSDCQDESVYRGKVTSKDKSDGKDDVACSSEYDAREREGDRSVERNRPLERDCFCEKNRSAAELRFSEKRYHAYDFDDTIYDGDCSHEYYYYAVKKNPLLLFLLPYQLLMFLPYLLRWRDRKWFKERFGIYLRFMDHEVDIPRFWDRNQHKIKSYYLRQKTEEDIVISASPEPLVAEMCRRLGLKHIIGTNTDMKTGKITGPNCYHSGKVVILRERMGEVKISRFYSDSRADTPMAELAEEAFLVTGERIQPW